VSKFTRQVLLQHLKETCTVNRLKSTEDPEPSSPIGYRASRICQGVCHALKGLSQREPHMAYGTRHTISALYALQHMWLCFRTVWSRSDRDRQPVNKTKQWLMPQHMQRCRQYRRAAGLRINKRKQQNTPSFSRLL